MPLLAGCLQRKSNQKKKRYAHAGCWGRMVGRYDGKIRAHAGCWEWIGGVAEVKIKINSKEFLS